MQEDKQLNKTGVKSPGRPRKEQPDPGALKVEKALRGIQKGEAQHKNVAMKNNIRMFVNGYFNDMTEAWKSIEDPYQKVMAFAKIMNFVYPQMRAVEFKGEEGKSTLEAKMLILMNQTAKTEVEDTELVETDS